MSVIGAGGHGKVVVSTLQAAGLMVDAVYDDDSAKHGRRVLGIPVLGPVRQLRGKTGARAVIAVGDNGVRKRLTQELEGLVWVSVIHPRAVVHESVLVGEGAVVFAGAVIQPEAVVGRHAIVNSAASVDHDCVLGDFSHVGPGAHLSGATVLGEGAFLGTASGTKEGVRVGAWTTVGVGGVVVRDLPERVVAVGVPARPLRRAASP